MSHPNKLRLELRVKNLALWNAIFQVDGSVAEFCRKRKVRSRQVAISQLLSLRRSPFYSGGRLTRIARWLCDETGFSPDELFPRELYERLLPKSVFVAEVPADRLISLESIKTLPMPEAIDQREVRAALDRAIQTLTEREQGVIRRRFGLDGDEPMRQSEVADAMGLSRSRVLQLQTEALRKLRHPRRSRELAGYW